MEKVFHLEKMAFFIVEATIACMNMTLEVDSKGGTIVRQHQSK